MPTFVLLSTLTANGFASLRKNPSRLQVVNVEIERIGARVVAQWAVLGPYDFVTVLEAPDAATAAEVAVTIGARGATRVQTLAAIPIDELLARLSAADDD